MVELSIIKFAKILASHYSNKKQAQENPKLFAHINIYFQPLPWELCNGPFFYSEQSYDYAPWSPYRQSAVKLIRQENIFITENYSIEDSIRFAGGGFYPLLLKELRSNNLKLKKGCSMYFKEINNGKYFGSIEPGNKCYINRGQENTYLKSEVSLDNKSWSSLDRGYSTQTNKQVWGSQNGRLVFSRVKDLSETITNNWLHKTC